MNPQEAAAVLGMFAANWSHAEVTKQTYDLWTDICKDIDPDAALAAAKEIICDDIYFPSVARFREAAASHSHAARNKAAIDRGLPQPDPGSYPSKERVAEIIAGLRVQLTARGNRKHWHGSEEPCPICGGHQ